MHWASSAASPPGLVGDAVTLGQALRVLHERKRIAAPWLPGMRYRCLTVCGGPEPDRTEPATVGCLAALAREALRDPAAYAWWSYRGFYREEDVWTATFPRLLVAFSGPTEGEAWARALLQLADELTRGEVLGG